MNTRLREIIDSTHLHIGEVSEVLEKHNIRPNSRVTIWRYINGVREPRHEWVERVERALSEYVPPAVDNRLDRLEAKLDAIMARLGI